MQNEITSDYLLSLAPQTVGSTTRYRLHNESDLQRISSDKARNLPNRDVRFILLK